MITSLQRWLYEIRKQIPIYDPVADTHLPLLRSGSMSERVNAATALSAARPGHTVLKALTAALYDPEPFVRWQVAQTLRQFPANLSLGYLLPLLHTDNASVVEAALWALPQPLPDQAEEAVLAACRHTDPGVRASALAALAETPLPTVLEQLAAGLTDSDTSVRIAAVQALAQRGDTTAYMLLRPLVKAWDSPLSDFVENILDHWQNVADPSET